MTEVKEATEALRQLEARLKHLKLPVLVLIGLPKTGEVIRVGNGLESANNRRALLQAAVDLIKELGGCDPL